jgi:hypothetical protein
LRAIASAITLALLATAAQADDAASALWLDTQTANCRIRALEAEPEASVSWSGACSHGKATGDGSLAWTYHDFEGQERRSSYTGTLRAGLAHGHGVIVLANGDRYDGDWADGKQHGRGVYVWANGDRYDGDWVNDEQSGRGTYVFANGFTYVGEWSGGTRHGQGRITWPDGKYYEGPFVDDLAHGIGECRGPDGNVAKCEFVIGEFSRWL